MANKKLIVIKTILILLCFLYIKVSKDALAGYYQKKKKETIQKEKIRYKLVLWASMR